MMQLFSYIKSLSKVLSQIQIEPEKLKIPQGEATPATIAQVLQLFFAILGGIAFLMIVISGLRYSLSRGNSDQITKAKNSIIYASVGLVVAVLAFSMVRFVVRSV